jgi:membrane protease YdiL (CAAX protease family)
VRWFSHGCSLSNAVRFRTIGLTPNVERCRLRGLVIGGATIAAVVAGIWAVGGYQADGFARAFAAPRELMSIGILLLCFVVQASVEEIVFRGWLLSVLARKFNVAIAVMLTCLVFTLLHYGQTNNCSLWHLRSCFQPSRAAGRSSAQHLGSHGVARRLELVAGDGLRTAGHTELMPACLRSW